MYLSNYKLVTIDWFNSFCNNMPILINKIIAKIQLLIFKKVKLRKIFKPYIPIYTKIRISVIITTQLPKFLKINKDFSKIEVLNFN